MPLFLFFPSFLLSFFRPDLLRSLCSPLFALRSATLEEFFFLPLPLAETIPFLALRRLSPLFHLATSSVLRPHPFVALLSAHRAVLPVSVLCR